MGLGSWISKIASIIRFFWMLFGWSERRRLKKLTKHAEDVILRTRKSDYASAEVEAARENLKDSIRAIRESVETLPDDSMRRKEIENELLESKLTLLALNRMLEHK